MGRNCCRVRSVAARLNCLITAIQQQFAARQISASAGQNRSTVRFIVWTPSPHGTAAIKEAMQAQRKRDAEICRTPLGPRLTDKDDYWSERYAAAIEREPI